MGLMDPGSLSISCIHKSKVLTSQPLTSEHPYGKLQLSMYVKEGRQTDFLAHTMKPCRMGERSQNIDFYFSSVSAHSIAGLKACCNLQLQFLLFVWCSQREKRT